MRGETYRIRSKLRELRLQETRRPRDIQAAPSQNLGAPGGARPDPFGMLNSERAPLNATAAVGGVGVGAFLPFSMPSNQILGPGTNTDDINMMDPLIDWTKKEESNTEWWEMNERSRSQRGGGFRTRFGSRQPAQAGQQRGQRQPAGQGAIGPPGGGGFEPTPGQNMPAGGGGGMGGIGGIGGGEGFAPAPGGNMPSDSGGMR